MNKQNQALYEAYQNRFFGSSISEQKAWDKLTTDLNYQWENDNRDSISKEEFVEEFFFNLDLDFYDKETLLESVGL
jgi:hypothetical protein